MGVARSNMAARLASLDGIVSLHLRRYTTRPHSSIDRIIRVDHAGEFGADRIYAGQMAVLGSTPSGSVVKVTSFMARILSSSSFCHDLILSDYACVI